MSASKVLRIFAHVLLTAILATGLVGCGNKTNRTAAPPPPPSNDCGPPNYACTAANNAALPGGPLAIVNNPLPVPNVGNLMGAGTVVTDPNFGNTIARCTDALTDPSLPNITLDTNGGGAAPVNHFNTNDSIVYLQEGGGHGTTGIPMLFDPNTMQCSRMYSENPSYASTGGLTVTGIGADFSYTNPNWLYVWDSTGGTATIKRYDFSNYSAAGAPTVTLIADFVADTGAGFSGIAGNCLPSNFVTNWVGHDGPSNDDSTFTAAYSAGPQDTGFYVVVWKVGSGCRVYNTSTGIISGDWGPTGSVSVYAGNSGTADSPTDAFFIHDIFLNLTGADVLIGNGSCVSGNTSCISTAGTSPYIWHTDSTNVGKISNLIGGAWTFGWNDFINRNNSPLGQYAIRPFTSLGSPRTVINTLPTGQIHGQGNPSWVNDNSTDSLPFFDSIAAPLLFNSGFSSAWTNEIIGIFSDGHTLRFAHNFITGSNIQYSTIHGIGSISQSGKFFMQSSDWLGSLGSTSGSSSCRWGYDWQANQTYPANFQYLAPQSGNAGGFVFQATSCSGSCTSGSTASSVWNQTIGGTSSDGTITWTNAGQQNCRGDVFIVRLQ